MAVLESCYFEPKHIPNSENTFCWPCERFKVSCRFFSLPPISSRIEWRHKSTAWLPNTVQNGGLHFVRIAGISEAKTSASQKAECLLVIGEGKQVRFLEGPFPLKALA